MLIFPRSLNLLPLVAAVALGGCAQISDTSDTSTSGVAPATREVADGESVPGLNGTQRLQSTVTAEGRYRLMAENSTDLIARTLAGLASPYSSAPSWIGLPLSWAPTDST